MRAFEYFEPASIAEAVSLLAEYGEKAKVIAGGTDLLVKMKHRVTSPGYLIDINRIPGLDRIDYDEKEGCRIGALATLHQVETSSQTREMIGVLAQAAHQVAAPRIRSRGTIGGNLCQDSQCLYYGRTPLWGRVPCYRAGGDICYAVEGAKSCQAMATADTAPALICLDAKARIASPEGERTIPLEEFFVSPGVTALRENEILTAIDIPASGNHMAGVYLKHSMRGAVDFAIAGAAVLLKRDAKEGVCRDARISLIGVARTPIRARRAEGIIKGTRIDNNIIAQAARAASEEARPLGDIYGSAAYRRDIVRVLVERAARQVWEAVKRRG